MNVERVDAALNSALCSLALGEYFRRFGHRHEPGDIVTVTPWTMRADGSRWITIHPVQIHDPREPYLALYRVEDGERVEFDGEGGASLGAEYRAAMAALRRLGLTRRAPGAN